MVPSKKVPGGLAHCEKAEAPGEAVDEPSGHLTIDWPALVMDPPLQ